MSSNPAYFNSELTRFKITTVVRELEVCLHRAENSGEGAKAPALCEGCAAEWSERPLWAEPGRVRSQRAQGVGRGPGPMSRPHPHGTWPSLVFTLGLRERL